MKKYNVTVTLIYNGVKSIKHYLIPAYSANNAAEVVTSKLRGYNMYIYSIEELEEV